MKHTPRLKLSDVSSARGAPMGRRDVLPPDVEKIRKFHLAVVPLHDGGCYDSGGAYWGSGDGLPLYCAWTLSGLRVFVRGERKNKNNGSPAEAMQLVRDLVPGALFHPRLGRRTKNGLSRKWCGYCGLPLHAPGERAAGTCSDCDAQLQEVLRQFPRTGRTPCGPGARNITNGPSTVAANLRKHGDGQ